MVIAPDASAIITDTGHIIGPISLPQNLRDELKAKLDAAKLTELQERYGTGNVADDFVRTLTVSDGRTTRSITVEEKGGQEAPPKPVQELFTLMGEIERAVRQLAVITPTVPPGTYTGTITYTSKRQVDNRNWEMTITEDGEATLSDGGNVLGTVQLEPDELESLRLMLAAADFINMKIYYGGGEPHPEGFLDTLVLETGGEPKRVTMEQGASFTEATTQERALFTLMRNTFIGHRARLLGEPTSTP
jgi:hypothetical protein